MKYTFSFEETNYGSISIDASATPTRSEVIDAIQNGKAFYNDTEYNDIVLVYTGRDSSKKEHPFER